MEPEECRNYLSDLFFDADQGVDRFIARTGASLGKAYRNGVMWFHVHFATNAAQYCSVFKRNPGANFHWAGHAEHDALRKPGRNRQECERRASDANRGFGQGIVLVKVAEFVEKPKRMTPTEIPSMVWLRPLNDCLIIRREMSHHFDPSFGVGKFSTLTSSPEVNRELGPVGAFGETFRQLSNGNIEHRPEQDCNCANLDIPLWIGRAADDEAYDLVKSVRIILKPHSVEVGCDASFDSRTQVGDFVISDAELENGAV
jgi:hypothetical protein